VAFRLDIGGQGVQDVWIVPRRADRAARSDLYEYGTSLRFFDEKIGAWQSTWIGPMHGVVRTFIARRIGDQVMLETSEGEAPRMRWSFSDIHTSTFSWRNELWAGVAGACNRPSRRSAVPDVAVSIGC
jgi:hypothetical protein